MKKENVFSVQKTLEYRLTDTIWVWYACVQTKQMISVFVIGCGPENPNMKEPYL